jgi:hypothetical protein
VLVVASVLGRRTIRVRWLASLSVVLPSWRFFERPGLVPRLLVRWGDDAAHLGPWHALDLDAPRPWTAVLLDPHGNLALAERSLLVRLLAEIDDAPDDDPAQVIAASTTYRLVQRLAAARVTALAGAMPGAWQLCVRAGEVGESAQDVLVSEVHP